MHSSYFVQNSAHMEAIYMPVAEGRSTLCDLVDRAEAGQTFILTVHGKPKAVLAPLPGTGRPWRAAAPADPSRYGDLQQPVMEEWA